jgi:hypothetical protein
MNDLKYTNESSHYYNQYVTATLDQIQSISYIVRLSQGVFRVFQ